MKAIYFSLLFVIITSCDKVLLDDETPNNPVLNFDVLWNEFDAKYGLFQLKHIDWDSVYTVYRPHIYNNSSDADLYAVLTEMLGVLNDNHVALVPTIDTKLPFFQSGILGKMDTVNNWDLELIKSDYLTEAKVDGNFTYGILQGNIGYLYIEGFNMPKYIEKSMDNVLNYLNETKAIVIDARGLYGGEDLGAQYIAGRFANETVPFMKNRIKSGAGKDDFTPFENWSVKPEGDFQFTKPIALVTHRWSISAKEVFCLAMRVLPQVTFVGDTTSGAFSNQINRELPNGWGYSLSIGEWVNANGVSYEGIGLPPDIVIQNTTQDVLNGYDEALEKAMEIVN